MRTHTHMHTCVPKQGQRQREKREADPVLSTGAPHPPQDGFNPTTHKIVT